MGITNYRLRTAALSISLCSLCLNSLSLVFPEPVLLGQSLTVSDGQMLINLYVQPPRKDSCV